MKRQAKIWRQTEIDRQTERDREREDSGNRQTEVRNIETKRRHCEIVKGRTCLETVISS